jgi:cbb3-type cytochrome oxidase subunit 3
MYRAFYENLTFAWVPVAATLFFVAFFAAVVARAFVFNRRRDFERVASLPLDDSEVRK